MPRTSALPRIEYQKIVLPNGLQLILHVDRKLPMVHVNQWYHVGSKNERPGRTGFAHLFEHLMFEGSKNAPGGYFSHVEKAGANLREGGVNGTTNEDRTNYFATVPSGNLEYLLWLESDRLATVGEHLTQENLDAQREVVRNERRQGLENQPYGRAFKTISENLFPAGHPYSWPVIGSHEDLIAATLEDVKEFFRTYYTPNNLSLCIAGDFDPAAATAFVERFFGSIEPGPVLARPKKWTTTLAGEKVVEVADRVPQERTYMVWPAPEYFHPDQASLDLASMILSDGLSARLGRALVYDRQLCSNVSTFFDASEIAGAFVVIATARPGVALESVEAMVTKELSRMARTGPTPRELRRAVAKWEFDFISGLERIGGFGGKADRLNGYNTYLGDPGLTAETLGRYHAVRAAAVKRVVSRWIDTSNRLLVRFLPEQSVKPTVAVPDRTVTPAFGPDHSFQVPPIASSALPNGLRVYVVERPDLPKVVVSLNVRAGSVQDDPGKSGTANLVVATIDRGTGGRRALAIEEAFGDLGTTLGGAAGREFSSLSFDVLRKNLDAALGLLADVVLHPVFPGAEFERERNLQLDSLRQEESNPSALAGRLRMLVAFGKDHPYGRPSRGLPSSVASITRADVAAFHRQHWVPDGAAIIFAGAITPREAERLVRRHLGRWRGTRTAAPAFEEHLQPFRGRTVLAHRPDSAQTVVAQVMRVPGRSTPDYHALRLADAVWGGGGFMTRLNLNLREDKGYSYGVFSGLALMTHAGVWNSTGSVQTDKTRESVEELTKELEGLAGAKPITEEELQRAKATRLRGYAQQFESLARIAGQVAELWLYDLPLDTLERELTAIGTLTLEEVNAAARRYARPEASTMVLVGDRHAIEPQLNRDPGFSILIVDAEGNLHVAKSLD